ncbi:phage tail domain-containing protein [Listeria kieliensis]
MDIEITKENKVIYGSDLNLFIKDLHPSAPSIESNLTSLRGRNGQINYGANHGKKTITLTAWLFSQDVEAHAYDRDRIYAVFSDLEPFYVSELFEDGLYKFERPGESSGFDLFNRNEYKRLYRCRYLVRASAEPTIEFSGVHTGGVVSEVTAEFETVGLPYGESLPRNKEVMNNSIHYAGTTECNQLESPFTLQATALNDGTNANFTVNDRTLKFTGMYKKGDVFEFKGVSNLQNGVNINNKTNYEFFILKPSESQFNPVFCNKADFKLEVLGYKDLYR